MKEKILKRLYKLQMEIIKANDKELDAIGVELAEIEKKLLQYRETGSITWDIAC